MKSTIDEERRACLLRAAGALEAELGRLPAPPLKGAPHEEWMLWRRQLEVRVDEILEQLEAVGARVRLDTDPKSLKYLGLMTTTTGNVELLLRYWVAAARRKAGRA